MSRHSSRVEPERHSILVASNHSPQALLSSVERVGTPSLFAARFPLILIAKRTAASLEQFYHRREHLPVVYLGLDHEIFNHARRAELRENARKELGLPPDRLPF